LEAKAQRILKSKNAEKPDAEKPDASTLSSKLINERVESASSSLYSSDSSQVAAIQEEQELFKV